MSAQIRAVIDVGTNSVKLLVASVENGSVHPLHESSHQTRLGHGFYETRMLQAGPIHETAASVAEFAAQAAAWKPGRLEVIATSAARDAVNKEELLTAIHDTSGLKVTIISGEQEADWAYRGVTSDPDLFSRTLLVMDVGGGSTELILGRDGQRLFGESFPLGSVRLLEKIPVADPPTAEQLARCESEIANVVRSSVARQLQRRLASITAPVQLVGTGGTSTILARMELQLGTFDRERIEGTFLDLQAIERIKHRLWTIPLAERRTLIGLPPNRADVILPGVLIFEQVMKTFALETLRVSTRGIRFAALLV